MPERSDFATGERTKVGAWVDDGIYSAFRSWVEAQTGRQYSEVGSALERAMLEYMDDDRIQDQLASIDDQTQKNEALLRQVLTQLDGDTAEKESGKTNSGEPPQGKNPGDRKQREMHVIKALYRANVETVSQEQLKQAVRDVAGVSSGKTVRSYVESITDTQAFVTSQQVGRWHLDRDAAADLLADHGIELEATA